MEMRDDDTGLEKLLRAYREACPEPEASQNFTPGLWAKIEARRGFLFTFGSLARKGAAVAAAFCLLLLLLNVSMTPAPHTLAPSYADALAAYTQANAIYGGVNHSVSLPAGTLGGSSGSSR